MIGYIATVTEFEQGWGQRPDGYIVCIDKADGLRFASKANGHVHGDYSCFSHAGDFYPVQLRPEMIEELRHNDGVLWLDRAETFCILN